MPGDFPLGLEPFGLGELFAPALRFAQTTQKKADQESLRSAFCF